MVRTYFLKITVMVVVLLFLFSLACISFVQFYPAKSKVALFDSMDWMRTVIYCLMDMSTGFKIETIPR
jgi:hypothetical protein